MLKTIKIVTTGYPECIQFNLESKLIYGKFLNMKIINSPDTQKPVTIDPRKPNSKNDIIPYKSNVSIKYKKMAGLCYFRTNRTQTSTNVELANKNSIVEMLLKEKGFPIKLIELCKIDSGTKKSKEKKKLMGVTTYDSVSKRPKYVKQVIGNSKLNKDLYYLPAEIPGKKLKQFIFTIKKLKSKLNF